MQWLKEKRVGVVVCASMVVMVSVYMNATSYLRAFESLAWKCVPAGEVGRSGEEEADETLTRPMLANASSFDCTDSPVPTVNQEQQPQR